MSETINEPTTSIRRGQFPRHKIGDQWWQYTLPDASHAGLRKNGNIWELYFRSPENAPVAPTAEGGKTISHYTVADAEQHIARWWRERIATARDQLPPLGEWNAPVQAPDRVHYKLTPDRAARVSWPDAGPRFVLSLENMTEREVRVALDALRRMPGARMLPQEVEF